MGWNCDLPIRWRNRLRNGRDRRRLLADHRDPILSFQDGSRGNDLRIGLAVVKGDAAGCHRWSNESFASGVCGHGDALVNWCEGESLYRHRKGLARVWLRGK